MLGPAGCVASSRLSTCGALAAAAAQRLWRAPRRYGPRVPGLLVPGGSGGVASTDGGVACRPSSRQPKCQQWQWIMSCYPKAPSKLLMATAFPSFVFWTFNPGLLHLKTHLENPNNVCGTGTLEPCQQLWSSALLGTAPARWPCDFPTVFMGNSWPDSAAGATSRVERQLVSIPFNQGRSAWQRDQTPSST